MVSSVATRHATHVHLTDQTPIVMRTVSRWAPPPPKHRQKTQAEIYRVKHSQHAPVSAEEGGNHDGFGGALSVAGTEKRRRQRRVLVLYGSETGTAEGYAYETAARLRSFACHVSESLSSSCCAVASGLGSGNRLARRSERKVKGIVTGSVRPTPPPTDAFLSREHPRRVGASGVYGQEPTPDERNGAVIAARFSAASSPHEHPATPPCSLIP